MGPYERQKREQQRAREREARRSELVGLGTPVSQTRVAPVINRSPYARPVSETRVAPVINRSPYEGVRIGNSQQGSYEYGKDMRENGFVERMDINGNYRWVDPKTGTQPDGSPLNPTRTQPDTRAVTEPTSVQQTQTEPQEPVASLPEPFTTEAQPSQEPTPVVAAMPTEESVAQNQSPPDNQQGITEDEKEDQAAAKGGEEDRFAMSRNFLATDKVPDSIFGYPIASRREDYTPEDIEFFRAHPEAGGYYDLGEGSPEDGTEEGAPVQDDEPVGQVSPEQKIVDDAWDQVSAQVGEDHLSDLANTFKVLSGEGSFSQPGASLAQVSNGHKARLAVAMNDAARKTANVHNNGRVYKPYTTLTNSSDVISGTAKDQAASTNWFDTATGRPRSHLAAGNLKLAEAIAQTIKDAGSFVLNQFQNPTNLLPARAVSYGDGRNGLGKDRVEIPRGPLPGSVRLDLPPGFRVGEDPNDPRRMELLRREGDERRAVEADAVKRGLAILFPKGRTVGSVLKAHKVDLGAVRKLNPGFNDRNVKPGQFIWIKNPDNDHDK